MTHGQHEFFCQTPEITAPHRQTYFQFFDQSLPGLAFPLSDACVSEVREQVTQSRVKML